MPDSPQSSRRLALFVPLLLWMILPGAAAPLMAAQVVAAQAEPVRLPTQRPQTTALNVEIQRIDAACEQLPGLDCNPGTAPVRWSQLATQTEAQHMAQATAEGQRLWRLGQQTTVGAVPDDRWLYWQRLRALRDLADTCPTPDHCGAAAEAFEAASRGFGDINFKPQSDVRILLTGFDPFGLHNHLDQSNPSGAVALALDDQKISTQSLHAEIQTAMFPVRFADFDRAIVENLTQPLVAAGTIDALITVSMGRSGFDLERFPGRRRSATAPDNLMQKTGASRSNPLVPPMPAGVLVGPEFVEFSLPVAAMLDIQRPFPVIDNRKVATLERGAFAALSLQELTGQTAVSGSGGGYLSNEISYRAVRVVRNANRPVVVGHIHTPRITGADAEATRQITQQILDMLTAALPDMARQAMRNRALNNPPTETPD